MSEIDKDKTLDPSTQVDIDLKTSISNLIQGENTPEMRALRELLLKRIALETVVRPARIPQPKNITEIGGYLNLLMQMNQADLRKNNDLLQENEMLKQTLASILGLPEKPNI